MEPKHHKRFEEIRTEVEATQKAILWEDARKGGQSVDEFLSKGGRNAKPVQRAGLIVFGLFFLLTSLAFASIPFTKHFEGGWIAEFLIAGAALALSLRLFRNAFRRQHPLGQKKIGDD